MECLKSPSLFHFLLLCFCYRFDDAAALECSSNKVERTIIVTHNGKGHFKTVQDAINSIPTNNNKWTRVLIGVGVFREEVTIPETKPCIIVEGAGASKTVIEWDTAGDIARSAFVSLSQYVVVKNIGFKNTYDITGKPTERKMEQAVAARFSGDKTVVHKCWFLGLQDTVWDDSGRHYFKSCYFEGGVDFIFGSGQTIYEDYIINVTLPLYDKRRPVGSITAQKRKSASDENGFVFKRGAVVGEGQALLGRAWGPYSRVIFYESRLLNVVAPQGWDAWSYAGHESNLTYVEAKNSGPGSNTAGRVKWMKNLSEEELEKFVDISYIDNGRWISKLPSGVLA